MMKRLATALGLFLLSAWSIARTARPPRPVPATAPDTVFSAERAMRHVEQIAVRPHAIGMPDHDRVRDYIVQELTALGVRPQVQTTTAVGTRYRSAGRVQNILAWMPGSDSRGKALLVAAHYDGVEAGPSAGDDAAGVAAVLETVRAVRARKTPLTHDVIFLLTDGEEAGLLGAAAFVREHPWAKDVAFVINFEARGTAGRSLMFETGRGDLSAVRALRTVGGVTAGSVFTTVYRTIANDTDLSELAVLGTPALNFAFASGVERYHTSHDDVAHLDTGSVQHHGSQMLGLVQGIAGGELPIAQTGDAVFFDLPIVGLVVYPAGLAVPLAVVALALAVAVAVREKRGALIGVLIALLAVVVSAFVARFAGDALRAMQTAVPWGASAEWRGVSGAAVAFIVLAVTLAFHALGKRWSTERGLLGGAIIVWAILAMGVAIIAPGASYLFTWPAIFVAAAALMPDRVRPMAMWIAAAVALVLLAGFIYGVSVVMLGVSGMGALALGVLVSLLALLIMPLVQAALPDQRLGGVPLMIVIAAGLIVVGVFTVRRNAAHPTRSALVYAQNADSADAWLGAFSQFRDGWTRSVIEPTAPVPAWTSRLRGGNRLVGRKTERVAVGAPSVTLVRDSLLNGERRVVFRVHAPRDAVGVGMRVTGAEVSTSSIDGRVVDTSRLRYPSRQWAMDYSAVPDSGAIVALSIPQGQPMVFEIIAVIPGLPAIPGVTVPPRPSGIVASQTGDATYVYKRLTF